MTEGRGKEMPLIVAEDEEESFPLIPGEITGKGWGSLAASGKSASPIEALGASLGLAVRFAQSAP
jgi:hypothetical protein